MPGEPTHERFTAPLPPKGPEPHVRQPTDSPDNILEQNNDATGGTELAR